jgi:hypothetical protein
MFPTSISLLCKSLPPRQTVSVQVRLLTDADSAVASSDTKSRIIENSRVVDGAIVPYGCSIPKKHSISFRALAKEWRGTGKVSHTNVELVLPSMTELRIVFLNDHLQEPVL